MKEFTFYDFQAKGRYPKPYTVSLPNNVTLVERHVEEAEYGWYEVSFVGIAPNTSSAFGKEVSENESIKVVPFDSYNLFFFRGLTHEKIEAQVRYDFSVPVYIETKEDTKKMGSEDVEYFKINSIIDGEFQVLKLANRIICGNQKHTRIENKFIFLDYFEEFQKKYGSFRFITETEFNKKLEEVKKELNV